MTFAEPVFLWGCAVGLIVFLAGLAALSQSRRSLARLSRGDAGRARPGPARAGLALEAAAFVLAACALAGPEGAKAPRGAAPPPADVMVALDVSRSMWAADVEPNRLDRAKRAIRALAGRFFGAPGGAVAIPLHGTGAVETRRGLSPRSYAGGLRIGFVTFAGSARLVCPLTTDAGAFGAFLDGAEMDLPARGGSNIAAGLAAALKAFEPDRGVPRAVVLVTDGEDRTDQSGLEAAAKEARGKGILLYALAVGTPEGAKIPLPGGAGFLKDRAGREVISRSRAGLLKAAARSCGGECLAATEYSFPADALYGKLSDRLDEAFEKKWGGRDRALFQWFLLAAVLLFSAAFFLPRGAMLPRRPGIVLLFLAAASGLFGSACGPWGGIDAAREGNRLFRMGRYGAAAASYERALAAPGAGKGGSFGRARGGVMANLALALYRAGRAKEALACLEDLSKSEGGAAGPVAQAARFIKGLCFLTLAEGTAEEAKADPDRLAGAGARARAAARIFARLLADSFHPEEAERNRDFALALAARIGRVMERGGGGSAPAGSGKLAGGGGTARPGGAAAGGGDVLRTNVRGGASGEGEARTGPRPPAGGWAGDPGPLSPEERAMIFARLKEIEDGRRERLARRTARRLAGEVEW